MTELLTVLAIIFIVAGPFLLVANYLRLPTAPALIIAGLVVGGFIDESLKLDIARLGIALLVFTFAVRIQTTDVQTAIADTEVVALGQLAVVGSAGIVLGVLLGFALDQALFIGIAVAISSSIIGSTLFLPGHQSLIHDHLSESIHSIQDFTGLFILLVVGAGAFALDPISQQIGYGVILLFAAIAINRHFYQLIRWVSGGSTESMLIGTVALLLLFLGAAEVIGVSIVVGAFAAGVAVRYDLVEYSGVINGVESINDFFAAIFFITVGALVTPPDIDVILLTAAMVILAALVKPAVTIALLIYKGYERRTATLTGFNLDQVGEFALIIAIEAFFLQLILPTVFEAIILAAAFTLVTSSFTRYYDEQIYHLLADNGLLGRHGRTLEEQSQVPAAIKDHVVIIGYGRYGHRLAEACEENEQAYVVVDSNPLLLDELQESCEAYVFGDIIEQRTVEKARIREARLVISTIDSEPVNRHLLTYADDVDVIVRTKNRAMAKTLLEEGAFYVTVSDLLAADYLEDRFETLIAGDYDKTALRAESKKIVEGDGLRVKPLSRI